MTPKSDPKPKAEPQLQQKPRLNPRPQRTQRTQPPNPPPADPTPPNPKFKPNPISRLSTPSDLSIHTFPTLDAFSTFLAQHSTTLPGISLHLAKKTSGIPSLTAAEAVEVALCYGWIDGRANRIDDNYWSVRFTPRRPKSLWSAKNVQTVGRLIEEGRMREGGLREVERAKEDGRWDRAYKGPATMEEPEDFKTALRAEPTAESFWNGLNKSEKYAALWKIETASVKARPGRVQAVVQMLREGRKMGEKAMEKKNGREKADTKTKTVQKRKAADLGESVPSATKRRTGDAVGNSQPKTKRSSGAAPRIPATKRAKRGE